ncbi:MAG: 3-isopropylmalate dehydratase small subunit [Alphaproteobacteria bacterium]|nr:3-isopropylmalate dehydratase small subunit [Alphaproteobacteria bacterium]
MQPFTTLTGVAAPLPMVNVDTDMIIPKQFLKTTKRTGLGSALFFELRTRPDGSPNPDFVLNKPAYKNAKLVIAGANFGCGSSREHAPWALLDFGIRCIVAPSFADIFYNNCFKNGVLPIALPQEQVDRLMEDALLGANAVISVDLDRQEIIRPDGNRVHFDIDPFRKQCLLNGWDDIGLTMRHEKDISDFEARRRISEPWA